LKKISLKIVLAIVLCSSFLLVSAGTLTFRTFSEIVKSNAMEELNVILENESLNFNSETARYITGVRSIKGVVLSKLDLSKLGNDGYLESYKADLGNMMAGVAESCNLVSSYFYFIPEIDSTEQISIDDYDGNGLFDPGKASDLGEADLSSPENDWFTGALEKGFNWSTPYYWEDADSLLISYTEAVEVDGRVIGVVGTDILADQLVKRFKDVQVLDSGRISLFNEKFDFIADEEFTGVNLSKVDPDSYKTMNESFKKGVNSGYTMYFHNGQPVYIFYKKMSNGWVMTSGIPMAEVFAELKQIQNVFILIILIGIVLAAVIAFFVGRSISRPIKQITKVMEELSNGEGNLTKSIIVHSKDETSHLADSFNTFVSNLKGIVSHIKESSHSNNTIVSSLNDSSSNAAGAAVEISSNVSSIENQIKKLNENIMETSSGIEQIGGSIIHFKEQVGEQVSAVEESSASIEEMIASLDNVSTVTNKKLESTRKLVETTRMGEDLLSETSLTFKEGIADKIDSIKDMVDTIANISSRTNLLAMNAAIEAAHAGESGKGFAVVADEIRKMAEEAAESSKSIEDIIKTIVVAIENTDDKVDKTSRAFNEIFRESNEINTVLSEIAASTVELSTGGQEILKAVELLNNSTSLISKGIEEIEIGSIGISRAIGNVNDISGQVFSGVREISSGVRDVSSSFEEVSALAGDLDQESKNLLAEVNRFVIK